jgi:uncharacterized integral membrane protein (TIGR00698 family)
VPPLLKTLSPGFSSLRQVAPGVAVAVVLALLAKALAEGAAHGAAGLPPISLSPVLFAVLLGMLWRNTVGVPAWTTEGLHWAMHRLLRTGIALVGLRLTLSGATAIAATAFPVAMGCLVTALVTGIVVAKVFGVPRRLGILLAIGTAVCGCTAVVAISPVIKAKHAETAFAVTCVVLFGCLAMLFYPWVAAQFFSSSPLHAGVFIGTAIHDTSQVIGAALIYSQQAGAHEALAAASVAKLLRNLSIAVLVPLAAWLNRRGETESAGETCTAASSPLSTPLSTPLRAPLSTPLRAPLSTPLRTPLIPFFVVAFILCLILRTAGDSVFEADAVSWHAIINGGQMASDLFLVCGMTAVGLNVSFTDMWRIGWRPLAAGFLVAILVGACSLMLTLTMFHFYR